MPFAELKHFVQAALVVDNVLACVTGDQWSSSTPCMEWTVADVTEHLIEVNHSFTGQLHPDGGFASRTETGSPAHELRSPDDLVARYRSSTEELRRALVCATQPDGHLPKPLCSRLALRVADLVIHGWDIATSTGGCLRFSDDLADEVLAFADSRRAALQRGGQFGPPQPTEVDAPAIDRLVALSGRIATTALTQRE
jgi:uncharacterized protein (TIGR03086 family)